KSPLGLKTASSDYTTGLTVVEVSEVKEKREHYELVVANSKQIDQVLDHRSVTFKNKAGDSLIIDLVAFGIFQFLWVWNDMLIALIFTDSGSQPITVALQTQVRQFGNNIDVLAPGAFISMVIPLVVFFAFQRQFVSGVMAGAVK